MTGIRNPKAHANMTITEVDAVQRLMFASLLMSKIDEAVSFTGISEQAKKQGAESQYMTSAPCLFVGAVFVNVTQQNGIFGGKGINPLPLPFRARKALQIKGFPAPTA